MVHAEVPAIITRAAARAVAESHVVGVLTVDLLAAWFGERSDQVRADPAMLAVTVVDDPLDGRVRCLQGIFDTDTRSFAAGALRRITARELEPAVRAAHAGQPVAIWE